MKWTAFLIVTALLLATYIGNAQTVNYSGKNVSLKKVFETIKKQTGTFFFYDADLLKTAKPVTVELKNTSLKVALNEIFKNQPLTWTLENRTVTVVLTIQPTPTPATVGSSLASSHIVKGFVTDENSIPIPGVSITIKATNQGTIADKDGRFSLRANQHDILVFSSLSYGSKEVQVQGSEMSILMALDIKPMESFIVGGNLVALKRKADASSVTVIDSKTLEKLPFNTIDQIFRGLVPGTNSFDVGDAPEGFPTLSIRGAGGPSSLTIIAVYVDGIEYAGGSGYLSQLDKNNIDRIEIVRGPGASTLYGTGSNGGIVQIFTKKANTDQISVNLTSSAGFYKSKWVEKNPFQQMHNLEMTTGFKNVALTLGGSYRTLEEYLPDGGEKNKGFYANARFNLGKLQANIIGRYNARNFGESRNPIYDTAINHRTDIIIEPVPGYLVPAYKWLNVEPSSPRHKNAITETYVAGVNLTHHTTKNWINKLDAGYTKNESSELPILDGITPFQRQYLSSKTSITTLRYSNTLTLTNNRNDFATVILSGAEYKQYSDKQTFNRLIAANSFVSKDPDNNNYGAFVQVNPSYKNVYLTLGLRYEKNELFTAAWNPRIGITTNFDTKYLTFKPRVSWGKGITAPSYSNRFGSPANAFLVVYGNPEIKPQSQQGFDYGLEVYDRKGKFKFEVVYYDNMLKDMITEMPLGPDILDPSIEAFTSTNAGEIANTGWEFSGEYKMKRFSLQASFSIMNTIVKDTSGSYLSSQFKDVVPGSRMLNLPKHTAGIFLTYNFSKLFGRADRGSVSVNVTEVDGVKYYDYKKYNLDVAYGRTPYNPDYYGYPVDSSPVFRLGLYADYQLLKELRFFMQGSNILNSYDYEYRSDFPTHGATWLFGLKYNFAKISN